MVDYDADGQIVGIDIEHASQVSGFLSMLQLTRSFQEGVTLKPAEASFRQGWQEAASGQTYPISELWGEIDVA